VVAAAPAVRAAPLADGAAVQGALAHWQAVLERIGFLDRAAPTKLMPRLNQLLNRAQLTADEVHILRGIARAAEQAASATAAPPLPRTPAERGKQG
jgi:tRNA/rRNA methyltransferase